MPHSGRQRAIVSFRDCLRSKFSTNLFLYGCMPTLVEVDIVLGMDWYVQSSISFSGLHVELHNVILNFPSCNPNPSNKRAQPTKSSFLQSFNKTFI